MGLPLLLSQFSIGHLEVVDAKYEVPEFLFVRVLFFSGN
jgi:hypothetical protein